MQMMSIYLDAGATMGARLMWERKYNKEPSIMITEHQLLKSVPNIMSWLS